MWTWRDDAELLSRAEQYAAGRSLELIGQQLGYGSDGSVWRTSRGSALKIFYTIDRFEIEWECYRRLAAKKIEKLAQFHVPFLLDTDPELLAIEMSLVQPPYLLDFGKVYLDALPTHLYDERQLADALHAWRERFGRRWPEVAHVLELLKKLGIYYFDPRPSNIDLGADDAEDEDWEVEVPPPPWELEDEF
jgi:hypothetical protein